jgi:hypothetical protein
VSSEIPVPQEEPPWREGPQPRVTSWVPGHRPALRVWTGRRWVYAEVQARHDYPPPDGRVVYRVLMRVRADVHSVRAYRWPQPGLRVAHGPREPSEQPSHIDSATA